MPRFERSAIIHAALVCFAVALVGKAAQVQLFQTESWRERAEKQHVADASLPAPRGLITDASGRVLVESRELVQLRVAPREVADRAALRRRLTTAGVPVPWVRRAVDTTRAWVELPGRWLPSDVASITPMRGVHPLPSIDRVLSTSPAVRRIVGRVDGQGRPLDGIELALDSVLLGRRGTAQLLRDARGGRLASPSVQSIAARPGHSVTLTLNWALQDIAERALADAVKSTGASGGDIVVLDPQRGEVLALAEPAPRPARDRGDGDLGAVRARVDRQAVHGRGAAAAEEGDARRHGEHRGRHLALRHAHDHRRCTRPTGCRCARSSASRATSAS